MSTSSMPDYTSEKDILQSSPEGDDEEARKWPSLEKLPTGNGLTKALFVGSKGEAKEIDVHKMSFQEKKTLMDRLINVTEGDNEEFLLKLRKRLDRVGINLPTIEVRYENLSVEAEGYVGSRALPTFINFLANMMEGLLNALNFLPNKKKKFNIIQNISGIVKPSRMTLLLGPPSSGKTSLLLALAGQLNSDLKVSGRVTYNGHEMNEFIPQRTAAYVSQYDVHLPEMTVRETLAFSARCQGVGYQYELLEELTRREKEAHIKPDPDIDVYMKAAAMEGHPQSVVVDYVLKVLGLEVCADTLVGNAMIRGISGGQKKRVTTGEMLVGPVKALFMDEISTGLDSSTCFHIVNSIKHYVHILDGTAFISLLQPAPETFDLFDDIVLLSEGQIVYQGPREHVLEFFDSVGFRCPERKGVADFLQEVTSRKDQEQYWFRQDKPYKFVTVEEFAGAFQSFHEGKKIRDELATPFDKSKSHPAALATSKYGVPLGELLKACMSRESLLFKRHALIYKSRIFKLSVMAVIVMLMYLRTQMPKETLLDGSVFMGALFFSIVAILFSAMSEMALTIAKLPVFYKQRKFLFYPPWVYAFPSWLLETPFTFVEVAIWVFSIYYVVGYDQNIGRFFKQYLLLVLIDQMAYALFRAMGAIGRDMIFANTFGSFALLTLFALGGFLLSRENIKKWWIWAYWSSPVMYAQNAIAVNEFLGHSWSHVSKGSTESLGVTVLKAWGFFPKAYWYWIGVGVVLGFVLLFNLLYILALTFLNPFGKCQAVIQEDSETSKQNLAGESIQLSKNSSDSKRSSSTSSSNQFGSTGNGYSNRKRGMVLPFQPLSITFDEIKYSVDMPLEMKALGATEDRLMLLKGVSGVFRPGVLTALMGVSGAGKTTLMDVLAGRKMGGYIEGDITISGYPKEQETFARICGYCEQTDIHSPHVTVYESLVYSAWLRLSSDMDFETRKMFVEEVMELVELNSLRGALVGMPGVSGLSTEQRKRLTMGVELVANPSIIFMDEPTSGLDARAAAIVMRTVRNTVDMGRAVICTIHQPSIDIFEAFDELFLMTLGGQEIYVGPLGHRSSDLINYFQGINGVSKIKDGYNPATWMLEVTTSAQVAALGVDFVDLYKNSDLYRKNKEQIKEMSKPEPGSKDLYFPSKYSQPFLIQWSACLWKQCWSYWRHPQYTAVRTLFTVVAALMVGTMFWNLGSKRATQQGLFNATASIYAAMVVLAYQNSSSVQPVVAIERTVFYREHAAGIYSPLPYALAQVMIELPYILVQAIVYVSIVYVMIGFEWTMSKFLWFLFFSYATLLYFTFFGMMAVALTPNQGISAIVCGGFYSFWNFFSGFIVPLTRIPIWLKWYYWANPFAWTLYGMIASQFGDVQDKLDNGETVKEFLRGFFGYRSDFVGVSAVAILGFTFLFAFVFAVAIKVLNFQKR